MHVTAVTPQLRTTDLAGSIRFYTEVLGFSLAFQYADLYAGIRAGAVLFHLKRVDEPDPSIALIAAGEHFHLYFTIDDAAACAAELATKGVPFARTPHDTPWGTREFAVHDDQGHVLYFAQSRA